MILPTKAHGLDLEETKRLELVDWTTHPPSGWALGMSTSNRDGSPVSEMWLTIQYLVIMEIETQIAPGTIINYNIAAMPYSS